MNAFRSVFFCILGLLSPCLLAGQTAAGAKPIAADVLIDKIIHETGVSKLNGTVDVIKEGNPDTPVTGVAVCMFATMDVLKQAAQKGCNLIIVHEPLYYSHTDDTKSLQNDPVFLEKKRFIIEHKLVVWRFHDYIHSIEPDVVMTGMVRSLGWQKYQDKKDPSLFTLPQTTLEGLLADLHKKFGPVAFNVVGKPDLKVTQVRLAMGAPGSGAHRAMLSANEEEVLIAGESPQWETYEYARDNVDQGRRKAVIFAGHYNTENAGMIYGAEWLARFIVDVPVVFIDCGSSYWTN